MEQRRQEQRRRQPIVDRREAFLRRVAGEQRAESSGRDAFSRGVHAVSRFCDRIHQQAGDVGAELLVELADAGRAGDVDLGDVAADHVQADEQHARVAAASGRSGRPASGRARSARGPTPLAPAARLPRLSVAEGMRASA